MYYVMANLEIDSDLCSFWCDITCFVLFTLQLDKNFLRQGLSEPEFYVDLVYRLKRIVGSDNFSVQFLKIISHYKKIGYNIHVLQQTACLVVNPITVGNFAFLFNCTPADRTFRLFDGFDLKTYLLIRW